MNRQELKLTPHFTEIRDNWEEDWTVEQDGTMIHNGTPYYYIEPYSLTEEDWVLHMMEKNWVDLNTFFPAYFHACRLAGRNVVNVMTSYL